MMQVMVVMCYCGNNVDACLRNGPVFACFLCIDVCFGGLNSLVTQSLFLSSEAFRGAGRGVKVFPLLLSHAC